LLILVNYCIDKDRLSEFDLKLVEIEGDLLGIPETSYQAVIQMPSSEFQKIVKDLSSMGDTVNITASKNGVKFSVSGEELSGSINVKQNTSVDKKDESTIIELQEGVSLTFALKYLNIFAKATSLAPTVCLSLSKDSPLMVEDGEYWTYSLLSCTKD
jgi:proliferating cell nuclear antigen